MSEADLQLIEIDPQRAIDTGRFLESYANLCVSELRGDRDDEPRSPGGPQNPDALFVAAEAASSYRDAAVWALTLNQDDAGDLLTRAATLFREADLPYALYLGALAYLIDGDGSQLPNGDDVAQLSDILSGDPERRAIDRRSAWLQPQQQAYAFLGVTMVPDLVYEFNRQVNALLLSRLADSTLPIGAVGRPIRDYVATGGAFVNNRRGPARGGRFDDDSGYREQQVVNRILDLTREGARRADLAAANTYLWLNAAARVDVLDLDVVAFTCAAVRAFGPSVLEALSVQLREVRSQYQQFQILIALQIAGPGRERPLFA